MAPGKYPRTEEIKRKNSKSGRAYYANGGQHYGGYTNGHWPWNKGLTLADDNRIRSNAGSANPMFGRPKTEADRRLRSEIFKKLNRDPEFLQKISIGLKAWNDSHKEQKAQIFRELNKDPNFIKKRLKALCQKPTKPERQLISLIEEYALPYKYVGDGSFVIEGFNPDFINVDGKKHIIEVFGRVWHEDLVRDWRRTELGRTMLFNSYGFKTLIIWDDELSNTEAVIAKIRKFDSRR